MTQAVASIVERLRTAEKLATPSKWKAHPWMENHKAARLMGKSGETVAVFKDVRDEGVANLDLCIELRNAILPLLARLEAAEDLISWTIPTREHITQRVGVNVGALERYDAHQAAVQKSEAVGKGGT